jgi:ribonuclease R
MKRIVTGKLSLNRRGFGFVSRDDGGPDVFIPRHSIGGAITGDTVSVLLERDSDKGPEGRVEEIITRERTHLVGTVVESDHPKHAIAYIAMLGPKRLVKVRNSSETPLAPGDRLYLEVLDWGDEEEPMRTQVDRHLGPIGDASLDIEIAMLEAAIEHTFPDEAVKEAKRIGGEVSASDLEGREDHTGLTTITIDPTTARDFDDALSLSIDEKGHYHLGVHIADVSHYVKPGSPLDVEAMRRSNSTYFPRRCIPMLPEILSNGLCSLNEGVVRLTASVFMTFDETGELLDHRITRSAIKSRKRFTYEEAKEVLDGERTSPHAQLIRDMTDLAMLLKKRRFDRGCVDLALPEIVLKIDESGVPTEYETIEYDITHQLVEEYMLKANEVVAKALAESGAEAIFRVHEEPSLENQKEFFALARLLGFAMPDKPTQGDVQRLMNEAKTSPKGRQLAIAFIKSMKQAVYSHLNVGHYGLSLEFYCHFTSPIRRYSDLIAHRLLFGDAVPDDLEALATTCSERERISMQAEMSVKRLKTLRFLKQQHEEEADIAYDATITKVKPFGFAFELVDLMVEGFIHVSDLDTDYFVYDGKAGTLTGKRKKQRLIAGLHIEVFVDHVDLIYGDAEWTMHAL